MSEKRFTKECSDSGMTCRICDNGLPLTTDEVVSIMNNFVEQATYLEEEIEAKDKEIMKLKSLLQYSDSMYGADLIVNIRFSSGEWKADVSVIDDE